MFKYDLMETDKKNYNRKFLINFQISHLILQNADFC